MSIPRLPNPTDPALGMLASLIHEQTGLVFEPNRFDLLVDKVGPLATESDCPTLLDYYYLLKYGEQSEAEWLRLQSALAVNETYFWREFDQIRAVVEHIVPGLRLNRPGQPVRIWHAACATGEEPYTMAIALREAGLDGPGRIEITATDFNLSALAQAREGLYRPRSFRSIPPDIMNRYFTSESGDRYRLKKTIREMVDFSYLNLMGDASTLRLSSCDIIMCRNVFIYFSDSAIRRVVEAFYHSLNASGYLFVASAESLMRITNLFELVEIGGAFGYQKMPAFDTKLILTSRPNGS